MDKQKYNQIIQGDCLEHLRKLPSESIDMVITSPPYDNLRNYHEYTWDFEKIAKELYRVLREGSVIVWIVADATMNGSETGSSFKQALFFKDIGFRLHDTMIWDKGTFTATGSLTVRYASVFEYMFVFSKGKPKVFHPLKDRVNKTAGVRVSGTIRQKDGSTKKMSSEGRSISTLGQRYNIWAIPAVRSKLEKTGHPAQFPEKLVMDHILSWSNPGDIILDPFMGSGTTAVSALKTGRKYLGFEISPDYCQLANERIKKTFEQ